MKRLSLYLGSAVLVAAASLAAISGRNSAPRRSPRVLVPRDGGTCSSPPNGFLFSQTVDGVQMSVCVSQEGNINQIRYPDVGHPQLALTDTAFGMSPTTLASRTTAPARASHPRVSAQQLSRRRLATS